MNMSRESQNDPREKKINILLLAVLSLFFFGLFAAFGTPIYNDSDQYIKMHVHREPVYPLFLFLLRSIIPDGYLTAASFLQSVLCIIASYRFVTYVRATFRLNLPATVITAGLVTAPYILTPLFSKYHVQMSVAVMSESLALPLYTLFIVQLHKAVSGGQLHDLICSLFLSLLLTLTRTQMIFTFILWLIAAVYVSITFRRLAWIALSIVLFLGAFVLRDVGTRAYNYVFNGRYIDSVYSHINLLANILYVTDREDIDSIEDEELKEIASELYSRADSAGYLYTYAGDRLTERVVYLEEVHDRIKYDCIEYGLRDIVEESTGIHDYIEYNRIGDGYAGDLVGILLPKVFGRWFPDALLLGLRGVVRNIAVCRLPAYIYVCVLFALCVYMTIRLFAADKRDKAALFMSIAILAVLGNSFSTALVIMCLSRYMIYGFAGFYTGMLVCYNKFSCIRK
ncbi:MAG: hypothetical protein IJ058_09605 [Lachnospiraceae bacterium]|nr:hypothetical protein [Lachnospiraceae bacterium]